MKPLRQPERRVKSGVDFGGTAVHRCDNCIGLNAALPLAEKLPVWKRVCPVPARCAGSRPEALAAVERLQLLLRRSIGLSGVGEIAGREVLADWA